MRHIFTSKAPKKIDYLIHATDCSEPNGIEIFDGHPLAERQHHKFKKILMIFEPDHIKKMNIDLTDSEEVDDVHHEAKNIDPEICSVVWFKKIIVLGKGDFLTFEYVRASGNKLFDIKLNFDVLDRFSETPKKNALDLFNYYKKEFM